MNDTSTQLLIIDPQNDFCDLPPAWCPTDPLSWSERTPALPVAGAHADMLRLAALVREGGERIDKIAVTLDSHHRVDIAHPPFWRRADGSAVAPFTTITATEVRAGAYAPRDPTALRRVLAYLDELEARGRYTLMVWPVHCEIGTWGHNIHAELKAALAAWEESRLAAVRTVTKGENPWTEHYSAVQAEVPDAADPATQLNRALIAELDRAATLLVGGEASSHCVRATVEHIAANLPSRDPAKIVLLTDCMSAVAGFEREADTFLADMRARGVHLATSAQALELLRAGASV